MSDLLSVVIPTFNEGGNIENLVSQIDEALEGINYEIIFVDDSKDNPPDIIKEVSKKYPSVRLYHRENKSGLATAVLDGFRIARGDYIACMDADLQHPPIVLKYMYKAIVVGGADVCVPSRFIPGGNDGGLNTESSYQEQQEKWGRLSSHALENLQTQQVDYLCSAGA